MSSLLLHGPYGLGKTAMLDAIQKSFDKSITLRISCEKIEPQILGCEGLKNQYVCV